jgi:transketolase
MRVRCYLITSQLQTVNLKKYKLRNILAKYVLDKSKDNKKIVFLTGDLGFSVLEPLAKSLGNRFINTGVAESLMMSMAASISSEGYKVFAYSIVPFATQRCLEQIRNDICYHKLDVNIIGVGAGFDYGILGPSHHAVDDVAAIWSIPNISVFSPANHDETIKCLDNSWRAKGPKYFRLSKINKNHNKFINKFNYLNSKIFEYKSGNRLSIITAGNILEEILISLISLNNIQLLSCPFLKPFPEKELLEKITSNNILIIDESNPYGGFSSHVCKILSIKGIYKINILTIKDRFVETVGDKDHIRRSNNIDSKSINKLIKKLI